MQPANDRQRLHTYLWFFGEIIKTKREDLKFTQGYVADRLGVCASTISYWELGKLVRLPTPDHFHDLCAVLELDPVALFEECDYVKHYPASVKRWKMAA